jgi:hypothetical protein
LREGLDLPEVSLVAVLDADKEGYLRSATALIQTIGRCARHINGRAILYADVVTGSMRQAMDETSRRRAKQLAYNDANGITPQSIIKPVDMRLAAIVEADYVTIPADDPVPENIASEEELRQAIAKLETQMREAAKVFEFERAAALRDRMRALQQRLIGGGLFSAADLAASGRAVAAPGGAAPVGAAAAASPRVSAPLTAGENSASPSADAENLGSSPAAKSAAPRRRPKLAR